MADDTTLTKKAITVRPYVGDESRVTVEINGLHFWVPREFCYLALRGLDDRRDAERLNWLEANLATAYASHNVDAKHWTVVDETRKGSRIGNVDKTLRSAIDRAMEADHDR